MKPDAEACSADMRCQNDIKVKSNRSTAIIYVSKNKHLSDREKRRTIGGGFDVGDTENKSRNMRDLAVSSNPTNSRSGSDKEGRNRNGPDLESIREVVKRGRLGKRT